MGEREKERDEGGRGGGRSVLYHPLLSLTTILHSSAPESREMVLSLREGRGVIKTSRKQSIGDNHRLVSLSLSMGDSPLLTMILLLLLISICYKS